MSYFQHLKENLLLNLMTLIVATITTHIFFLIQKIEGNIWIVLAGSFFGIITTDYYFWRKNASN